MESISRFISGGGYLDLENIELLAKNFDQFEKAHCIWYSALKTLSKEADTIKEKLIPKVNELKVKGVNDVGLWGTAGGKYKTIGKTQGEALEPMVVLEQNTTNGGSIVLDLVVGVRGYRFIAFDRGSGHQSSIEARLDNANGKITWKKHGERALIMERETSNSDGVFAREEDLTTVVNHAIKYFQIICE